MSHYRLFIPTILLLIPFLLLAACSPGAIASEPSPTSTPVPTETPTPTPLPTPPSVALDDDTMREACGALTAAVGVGQAQGLSTEEISREIRFQMGWNEDQLIRALEKCVDYMNQQK